MGGVHYVTLCGFDVYRKTHLWDDDSENSKQTVIDYVQKAVEVQTQESKEEKSEKEKRKTSIIVHGLPESADLDTWKRSLGW